MGLMGPFDLGQFPRFKAFNQGTDFTFGIQLHPLQAMEMRGKRSVLHLEFEGAQQFLAVICLQEVHAIRQRADVKRFDVFHQELL